MIINGIKSEANLSHLYNQFLDELTMLINSRSKQNIIASERDQIIIDALLAKHDLSDMDLQKFLTNQINTKSNLLPKEDLLLKVLKRNNNLE